MFMVYCVCELYCRLWPVGVTYYAITDNLHKNIDIFVLNFTLDLGPRFDTSYLDITIQEVAKFKILLKFFFGKGPSQIF